MKSPAARVNIIEVKSGLFAYLHPATDEEVFQKYCTRTASSLYVVYFDAFDENSIE